jgi:hypothetical protein
VHDIAAFKFDTVVSSTVIGWVWQFTLQSTQRHNQISKIGDIFEKISAYFAIGAKTQPNFENWRYFRKNQYSESVNVKFSSKKRRCEVVIKEYGDIISFQH